MTLSSFSLLPFAISSASVLQKCPCELYVIHLAHWVATLLLSSSLSPFLPLYLFFPSLSFLAPFFSFPLSLSLCFSFPLQILASFLLQSELTTLLRIILNILTWLDGHRCRQMSFDHSTHSHSNTVDSFVLKTVAPVTAVPMYIITLLDLSKQLVKEAAEEKRKRKNKANRRRQCIDWHEHRQMHAQMAQIVCPCSGDIRCFPCFHLSIHCFSLSFALSLSLSHSRMCCCCQLAATIFTTTTDTYHLLLFKLILCNLCLSMKQLTHSLLYFFTRWKHQQ